MLAVEPRPDFNVLERKVYGGNLLVAYLRHMTVRPSCQCGRVALFLRSPAGGCRIYMRGSGSRVRTRLPEQWRTLECVSAS